MSALSPINEPPSIGGGVVEKSSLTLYPFQRDAVNYLVDKRAVLIGDDMRPGPW